MASLFRAPQRILTGIGSISELPDEAAMLGDSAFLVTGQASLRASGRLQEIVGLLDAKGVDVTIYSARPGETTTAEVDEARELFAMGGCEFVVAIGGGSVLDLGKAVAALARAGSKTSHYLADAEVESSGVPMIAVPTTSGTGSEATPNSVLIDFDRRIKKSLRAPGMMPLVAILDPELTVSVPPDVTASSGMDAFTQAVESYLSVHATPLTEALSISAVELISGNIRAAHKNGADISARSAMAYGSFQAGVAMANARLGAVHGIAHPLGARYGVPHGVACAVLLPRVLEINRPAASEKMVRLDRVAGRDVVRFTFELLSALGLPADLKEYQLDRNDFPAIVEESLASGSLKANPKKFTAEDVLEVLKKIS